MVDTGSSSPSSTGSPGGPIGVPMHRRDVAGGSRVGSRCHRHRGVLSVHLRGQHGVVDEVHGETSDPESKTEGKIKGRPLI
jgi:hypothetical protein